MIPIYPVEKIRQADKETLHRQNLYGWQLMERAVKACFDFLLENEKEAMPAREKKVGKPFPDSPRIKKTAKFFLFCGRGDKGGDGFGLAWKLIQHGCPVEVWLPDKGEFPSEAGEQKPGFTSNALRNIWNLIGHRIPLHRFGAEGMPAPSPEDILIDALVGTGLAGRLDPPTEAVVRFLNACPGKKYSIDLPSGLFADKPTPEEYPVVENSLALSFQFPKQAFLFAENEGRPLDFAILDIHLDESFMVENPAEAYLLQAEDARRALPPRPKFAHKGRFGHGLLIAGSQGMAGAAILAGRAALRSGCGLLGIASEEANRIVLQTAVPEALFVDQSQIDWARIGRYSAIGIGPGLGTSPQAALLFKNVLRHAASPLLVDADGLNLLAQNPTLLEFLPTGHCILTPHPKEFERLAGKSSDSWERVQKQQEFSNRYGAIVVLKGAHTSISLPSSGMTGKKKPVLFNSTGNPGMATGGSGDVLSGIILALLAQGLSPVEAACTAVFLHGLAGDLAAEEKSETALIASDLAEFLPQAFRMLQGPDRSFGMDELR